MSPWSIRGGPRSCSPSLWRNNDHYFSSSINCAFMFITWLHVRPLVQVTRGWKCATYCLINSALKCRSWLRFQCWRKKITIIFLILLTMPAVSLDHLHLNVVLRVPCSICEPINIYTYIYICTPLCILNRYRCSMFFNRLFWKINVWKNTLCCFFPLKDLKALGLLDSMSLISCLKNVKKSEVYVFDMHF